MSNERPSRQSHRRRGERDLTATSEVVDAFGRGLHVAAAIAALLAVIAWLRLPATRASGSAGMHMHH
ncbi:hypothetical protein [Kineosporia sp. R_H_3]|uniref:hypothetical protein n=1 Tax=Kineosporia sp. R_H_3 TaxID=1961848 RepID=UPI000B4ACD2E|nr:hypothetical protein [Kineosporia sp. R_H_3]